MRLPNLGPVTPPIGRLAFDIFDTFGACSCSVTELIGGQKRIKYWRTGRRPGKKIAEGVHGWDADKKNCHRVVEWGGKGPTAVVGLGIFKMFSRATKQTQKRSTDRHLQMLPPKYSTKSTCMHANRQEVIVFHGQVMMRLVLIMTLLVDSSQE